MKRCLAADRSQHGQSGSAPCLPERVVQAASFFQEAGAERHQRTTFLIPESEVGSWPLADLQPCLATSALRGSVAAPLASQVRSPPRSSLMKQWVGRYVYSSDGKDLGKIASVRKTGTSSDIYFDMGGFLGLGATRKQRNVRSGSRCDRTTVIVLRLSEADAQKLPAARRHNPEIKNKNLVSQRSSTATGLLYNCTLSSPGPGSLVRAVRRAE